MHGSVYACTWWLGQEPLCSLDIPLPLVIHSVVLSLLINACLTCQVSASLHHNVVIFTDVQMDVCQNDQLPSSAFVVNMCKQTLSIDCVLFQQRMEAFLLLRKGAFAVASSLCLDKYMYIHYIYKSIYCIQLETWIPFSFLPWCCVLIRQTRHFPEYLIFLLTQKATND